MKNLATTPVRVQLWFKDADYKNVYAYPVTLQPNQQQTIRFNPASDRVNVQEFRDFSRIAAVGAKVWGQRANLPVLAAVVKARLLDRVEITTSGSGAAEKQISAQISEIVENSRIIGRVFGIQPDGVSEYKVLVYVKTDKWYIHPYERGGDGLSFASINRDGSWQIETVKRRFLADLVAVLVVPKDYAAPSQVEELRQIKSVASYTRQGEGKL